MDELGAGNFPVDGRMSFTGSSINSIACSVIPAGVYPGLRSGEPESSEFSGSQVKPGMTNCGILMIQNSPLAQAVNFFNGKVTINKDGLIQANSLALGNQSLGEGIIPAGQTEIVIESSLISLPPAGGSRVFITPISPLLGSLYIDSLEAGQSFKVKLSEPNLEDVKFNWMIVQSKEASN